MAGVGAVLGFVPQMLVLFLLLAILEDCGYMARIAFIMDRIFRRFIPSMIRPYSQPPTPREVRMTSKNPGTTALVRHQGL